jgi:hypothetical protein
MSVVDAQAATATNLCTQPNCPNDAGWSSGLYAGLCRSHAMEKKRKRAETRPAPEFGDRRVENISKPPEAITEILSSLRVIAVKLERAERAVTVAQHKRSDLKREWNATIARLQQR